jgi:hypothetical protein
MHPESLWTKRLRASLFFLTLVLAAGLLFGCKRETKEANESKESGGEAHEEKPPQSRVKHGTNGEIILTVEAEVQKTMGLKTTALEPASLASDVKAYGRVLDSSSLASSVADLISAQAASAASQAELARLKNLVAQNNTSARAVEAQIAVATRDQAQVQAIRLRLLANWGGALAQRDDLASMLQSLGSLESALVQLDLPAGEPLKGQPTGARLLTLANETQPVTAQFLGPAPVVDPQMQGRGFLFLVQPNTARLAPGAAVTGYLDLPGEAQSGVLLPRDAVLHFNGATWVYVQRSDTTFERDEIALERPLTNGWFVKTELKPQDKIVTVGAQQLLSEELKGQVAE